MANPYATGDMNPFQDDFRRAPPPGSAGSSPAVQPPPSAAAFAPAAESHFYSPSGTHAVASQPYSPPAGLTREAASTDQVHLQMAPPPPRPGTTGQQPQWQQQQQGGGAAAAAAAGAAPGAPEPVPETSKFWTFDFYRQFFDVDTRHVLLRMSNTLIPINPPDFLLGRDWHATHASQFVAVSASAPAAPQMMAGGQAVPMTLEQLEAKQRAQQAAEIGALQEQYGVRLNPRADFYGPFWITTTLWMVLAIVSNIMSKLAWERQEASAIAGSTTRPAAWRYSFTMAAVACVTIYSYCAGMSILVWAVMKWKDMPVGFSDTLCLYGYSMFIFILIAILCMAPVSGLQWLFAIVGGLWSLSYLLVNFWKVWRIGLEPGWFYGLVIVVFCAHMLLSMAFKFYFLAYAL